MLSKKNSIKAKNNTKRTLKQIRNQYDLYLLFLIPFVWYLIFMYGPMYGLQIAFKQYNPTLGITASPWAGMKYFQQFFDSYYFTQLLSNTVILSLYQMLLGFPIPIILALIINELKIPFFKKTVQNITYIPYFLSIVVICSMLRLFSNPDYGLFNQFLGLFGIPGTDFFASSSYFRTLYVFSGVWQNMGFNSIIYIAALASIDPTYYEAADLDGASRIRKIWHVSLPCILPTIIILFILRIGSIMTVGYEKVYLMQNSVNLDTAEVISTFIYKNGIQKGQFSYSAAVGIFNSIINFIFLICANFLSKKVAKTSLW